MLHYSAFVLAVLSLISSSSALGINGRGSSLCAFANPRNDAQNLVNAINRIDINRWYNNGQHVACTWNNICAFLQNTGGGQGAKILEVAHYIADHGCDACGSVPTDYPRTNDVANGQLTFNYVSSPACQATPAEGAKLC